MQWTNFFVCTKCNQSFFIMLNQNYIVNMKNYQLQNKIFEYESVTTYNSVNLNNTLFFLIYSRTKMNSIEASGLPQNVVRDSHHFSFNFPNEIKSLILHTAFICINLNTTVCRKNSQREFELKQRTRATNSIFRFTNFKEVKN